MSVCCFKLFVIIHYSSSRKLIFLVTDYFLSLILKPSHKCPELSNMLPLNPFPAEANQIGFYYVQQRTQGKTMIDHPSRVHQ